MLTRFYMRELKDGVQFITCYDVQHNTDKYSGINAALQVAAGKGHQVIAVLDAIILEREGTDDN